MGSIGSLLIAVSAAVVIVYWLWFIRNRDARHILQTRYPAEATPPGPFIECEVRFPLGDIGTPCVAQATEAGLSMVSTKEQIAKWRWMNNTPYLKRPVFIPWTALDYYPAKFPMQNWMRFDIRDAKATFFLRQSTVVELLQSVGLTRQIS